MENNEQNNNMTNKGVGFLIIVVALLVVIIGLGGYVLYDKILSEDSKISTEEKVKKEEKKEEKEVALDVTSKEVTDLFNSITSGWNKYCGVDNYFADKKVTVDDIDNDLASSIMLYNLIESGVKHAEGSTFTKKQVEDIIVKLFGKKYKYTYKTINSCPSFTYDEAKELYTAGPSGCGGICGPHNMKKVVKATKTDSKIELYVRVLFVGSGENIKYYNDYKTTKEVSVETNENGFALENDANYQKGSLYKMTFTKEDNNYVFTSSEPVNE